MTNATVWDLGATGWANLTNQTNMSVVQAAISGWQQSGNGIAAMFVFSALVFLAVFIVYARTKNTISSALVGILTSLLVVYYDLLTFETILGDGAYWYSGQILYGLYIILVIGVAIGIAKIFLKD